MNDLFKKLNTLVKSSIHDLLGDDPRQRSFEPGRLGKNIDQEIKVLRQRVNEAVAYEGKLQSRVGELQAEVVRWDRQADAAVAAEEDVDARYAITQMKLTQQRLEMAESDLRDHQRVTQELIQRVNTLEATVADARRAEAERTPQASESAPQGEGGRGLADVLRDAREKIGKVGDLVAAKDEVTGSQPPVADAAEIEDDSVEDDLENRRQRLSKR